MDTVQRLFDTMRDTVGDIYSINLRPRKSWQHLRRQSNRCIFATQASSFFDELDRVMLRLRPSTASCMKLYYATALRRKRIARASNAITSR